MKLSASKLTLPVNTSGRDFVVGDLHGCVDGLYQQLQQLNFDEQQDRLICVGDLIDRGPQSQRALELLEKPWFFSVLGNHEYLMVSALKYHNNQDKMLWLQHGGDWITSTDPCHWPDWFCAIEAMPIAIEVQNASDVAYGIVHADYPLNDWHQFETLTEHELKQCIWGRTHFKERSQHVVANVDFLVHGHNISEQELQLGNRLYIDQGAYLGNPLTIKQL